MHRRFIAAIAAASITITAVFAAPAQALDRDAARALAAIAGIAIIGAAINDHNKKKKRQKAAHQAYQPPAHRPRHIEPRPLPRHVNRKLLPQQCLRNYRDDYGTFPAFSSHCLRHNYKYSSSLPQRCERSVYTDRGYRTVLGARCLSRQGYQLARR